MIALLHIIYQRVIHLHKKTRFALHVLVRMKKKLFSIHSEECCEVNKIEVHVSMHVRMKGMHVCISSH